VAPLARGSVKVADARSSLPGGTDQDDPALLRRSTDDKLDRHRSSLLLWFVAGTSRRNEFSAVPDGRNRDRGDGCNLARIFLRATLNLEDRDVRRRGQIAWAYGLTLLKIALQRPDREDCLTWDSGNRQDRRRRRGKCRNC
jgi:hypothetical protein